MKYFSVVTAFLFYCNAKHSDILWGSSHIDCYLLLTKLMRVNNTANVIHIHNCHRNLQFGWQWTMSLHKNVTLSFLYDVFILLELWMVPILIFISSRLQVFLSRFDLFLAKCISNGCYVYTFLTCTSQGKNNQTLNNLKSSVQLDSSKEKNENKWRLVHC